MCAKATIEVSVPGPKKGQNVVQSETAFFQSDLRKIFQDLPKVNIEVAIKQLRFDVDAVRETASLTPLNPKRASKLEVVEEPLVEVELRLATEYVAFASRLEVSPLFPGFSLEYTAEVVRSLCDSFG